MTSVRDGCLLSGLSPVTIRIRGILGTILSRKRAKPIACKSRHMGIWIQLSCWLPFAASICGWAWESIAKSDWAALPFNFKHGLKIKRPGLCLATELESWDLEWWLNRWMQNRNISSRLGFGPPTQRAYIATVWDDNEISCSCKHTYYIILYYTVSAQRIFVQSMTGLEVPEDTRAIMLFFVCPLVIRVFCCAGFPSESQSCTLQTSTETPPTMSSLWNGFHSASAEKLSMAKLRSFHAKPSKFSRCAGNIRSRRGSLIMLRWLLTPHSTVSTSWDSQTL